jgi:dTDP-4-amino-4,6-dideoxygalactose transaminase
MGHGASLASFAPRESGPTPTGFWALRSLDGLAGGWVGVAPALPPSVYLRPSGDRLPFPLEEPNYRLFARARHGLFRALQVLALERGDEALAPAFHHGSEIATLEGVGLRCRFYDLDLDLSPNRKQLERLVGPRTRVLHLIHYLGWPQDAQHWRAWCREHGLILVEDAAQSWLSSINSRPVGSFGDVAIFCLHKSFRVPDGGAVVARRAPRRPTKSAQVGTRQTLFGHREWLAQRVALDRFHVGMRYPHRRPEPVERFLLGDPSTAPFKATLYLLPRLSYARAAERRRMHYAYLRDRIGDIAAEFTEPFPDGAVPYVFPVWTPGKASLLDQLEHNRITGGQLWQTPHASLDADAFPVAAKLRSCLLGLPVHQELRRRDLDRIVRVVRSWMTMHSGDA